MKKKTLWQVSIITSLEAEEAVVELLGKVFKRPAAVYSNEKTKVSRASIYCRKRSEWTPSKRESLVKGLQAIRASGLNPGAGRIAFKSLPGEDWAESWKRHFKPIAFGKKLLVKPSWIKSRPVRGQAVVILDPGLSFGTGNHATTSYCLEQIAAADMASDAKSFLDLGTGSGILAIAAAKLGFGPIRAVDFDPEAVRVARRNARQNGVEKCMDLRQEDITCVPMQSPVKYDFVCANLISNLLIAERRRIFNRLKKGGRLVLAGILRKEFPEVQEAFEELGLELVDSKTGREWRSGSLVKRQA
jgi:ribosomal protein L11 methyltransferase